MAVPRLIWPPFEQTMISAAQPWGEAGRLGASMQISGGLRAALLGVAATIMLAGSAAAQGLAGWGVVVMHGKQSTTSSVGSFAGALKAEGAVVATPTMTWSSGRMYDATVEGTIAEIDAA